MNSCKTILPIVPSTDLDYWNTFLSAAFCSPGTLANNADLETAILVVNGQRLPVTINKSRRATTSWVASLRNSYGPYARAETDLTGVNGWIKPFYLTASHVAEHLLCSSRLGGGLFLNNWLIATNLYGPEFDIGTIMQACDSLIAEHGDSPIIIRSLTPPLHSRLLSELISEGFFLIPTRQVWLMQNLRDGSWRTHSDIKKDLRLEMRESNTSKWIQGSEFTDEDFCRTVDLYNQLYRGKYPEFNPDYTKHFFQTGVRTGWLSLNGLRSTDGSLSGIVGVIRRGDVFATPVLGYDTQSPQRQGLYRRLMLKAFLGVEHEKGVLHCSGGAGGFKQQRGANFDVEFAAIWVRHMPKWRRLPLHFLDWMIRKIAVPYLQRHVL